MWPCKCSIFPRVRNAVTRPKIKAGTGCGCGLFVPCGCVVFPLSPTAKDLKRNDGQRVQPCARFRWIVWETLKRRFPCPLLFSLFILAFVQVVLFCYFVIIQKVVKFLSFLLPWGFAPLFILRLRETLCTRFYLFSVLPEIRTDKSPYYQESPYNTISLMFPCGLLALRNRVAPSSVAFINR